MQLKTGHHLPTLPADILLMGSPSFEQEALYSVGNTNLASDNTLNAVNLELFTAIT